MAVVQLPIVHIRQAPGLCGAATAQMILHAKGLAVTTPADQQALFGAVQAATQFARPTRNVARHDCPAWPGQLCTKCPGEAASVKFRCWCTYPPALKATMSGRGVAVKQRTAADPRTTTAHVIDSIDRNLGAAVLVENGLHWIAVIGYVTGPGPNSRKINGKWISDLYVHDPNLETGAMDVPIIEWLEEYLTPVVQCGDFLDKVVAITAAPPANR